MRGVINSFFLGGAVPEYVSVSLAAFKVVMLPGCCPRGPLRLINLSWETGLPCSLLIACRDGEGLLLRLFFRFCLSAAPKHPPLASLYSRVAAGGGQELSSRETLIKYT